MTSALQNSTPPIDLARSIPVLPSLNIPETRSFYVDQLGFALIYEHADYLLVRRDQIEFHFRHTSDRSLPENSSSYIRGRQIADLYEEFSNAGIPRLSAFEFRPWTMKEFTLHDPHGNVLRFGMADDEAP